MSSKTNKPVVSRKLSVSKEQAWLAGGDGALRPFKGVLSLDPLVAFWRQAGAQQAEPPGFRLLRQQIEGLLADHPEVQGALGDVSALEGHEELLDLLMTSVFPVVYRDRQLAAALVPFEGRAFYATPSFEAFVQAGGGAEAGRIRLAPEALAYGAMLSTYVHLFRSFYDVDVPFEHPIVVAVREDGSGLERHYRITLDHRFLEIRPVGEVPPLSDEDRHTLLGKLTDLSVWMEVLPADAFTFYGFDILHAEDVTNAEILTQLERELLEGDGMLSGALLPTLAARVGMLLQKPNIKLGLAALEGHQLYPMHRPDAPSEAHLFGDASYRDLAAIRGSIFDRALRERMMQVVEDLEAQAERTPLEDEMLEAGARSLLVAPLIYQARPVGVLYLWSEEPGQIDALNMMKLTDVLPLFAAAVKRGKEELHSRVQAVILGEYTAIHPSVEWRFRQAALSFIRRQERGYPAEVEPIIFHEVYPLFAAADIRGSSTHRNEAVRADLLEHLNLAADVLRLAREQKPLPILDHLLSRAGKYEASLETGLSSGDEATVRDFLQRDIEPVFDHLQTIGARVQERIQSYKAATNTETGSLYHRCSDFERSVTLINRTIATYLDVEEAKAQQAFPHYFEKHQTDGVDFSIYVGASLVENGEFDPLYVRNLRLWQLMVMCGIARRVEPLKRVLNVPLEVTHLILTQATPLSIRFRFDETRFDVDGAHHIRYEIMKQRIEKATLKGRDERLTQPGKIAIVYSQAREAWEYEEYIEFLQEKGLLGAEVESLELSDLQGMRGLKALRVTAALDEDSDKDVEITPDVIDHAMRALPARLL